ncbi:MAG TPA: hypothetical protein VK671_03835, partial [Mucilaginibacter sp.]|nr:hypothetical protein [Mucilaginibacter sp.]
MKTIFLTFLIITGFKFCGICQTKSAINDGQIVEVIYYNSGSEMGGLFYLKISKDSIKYYGDVKKTD